MLGLLLVISSRWSVDILGGKKPLSVLNISNSADGSGVVVLIPTCEKTDTLNSVKIINKNWGNFIFFLVI
jgi:hypothetical protein